MEAARGHVPCTIDVPAATGHEVCVGLEVSLPPESIQVDQCYLADNGQVRRVVRLLSDRRIQYDSRPGHRLLKEWRAGVMDLRTFAFAAERPFPCDWTPETGE